MTKLEEYKKKRDLINKYSYANFVITFDEATVCPKNDKEYSLEVSNYFYKEILSIIKSDEYYNLLASLKNDKSIDEITLKAINKEYEDITKERLIPNDFSFELMDIQSKTYLSWQKSTTSLNYDEFEKNLDELVNKYKDYTKFKEGKLFGYDVLLDEMEDDFNTKIYDDFFNKLEKELMPLVKKILSLPKKYNENIKNVKFDIDKQRHLTKKICDLMGYTDEVGYVGETLHPFTNGINSNDVRTTTKYDEKLLFSNIYSVMHEVGHATYELQNNKDFSNTVLMGGTSTALHESQSRFYENYLGRSKEFIEFLYPILKDLFKEELKDYTFDDIYYYINDVSNEPIRTEADELTYPFHIIIRYKIEKMLFEGKLKASEINDKFNELMNEYLSYIPKNKKEGCFQDVHWSSDFGYFPTYALGSAISAQLYFYMQKDLDVKKLMSKGDFKPINEWLKEHIHKYGRTVKNLDLIKLATGEDFNPDYYINYLKDKFKKIYNI